MDKWKQLRRTADTMSGPEIERNIWSISEDPRFPAVIALLTDVRFTRLANGSGVAAASDHGLLAHCMGGVEAIDELERRMQGMVELPAEEKAE